MDKQEYKILTEEIMTLIASEQFVEAAKIADKIDWRKVRSFSMLQRISDLYKSNRRYEEALEIELLAYDRNSNSRSIVYSLCELYLETGDLVSALQYLALFKRMAPNDASVYILQYKVLELEETSLEDKIELLEEFCRKDYREEWAYQLAYLYHRIGFATKCIEACDQLITWFGDGPFVIKAMELKMLHTKLTPKQQEVYDKRMHIQSEIEAVESDEYTSEKPEPGAMPELGEDEDFHVKTIDMSKFNTINLQKALAESMRELMGEEENKNEKITQKLMSPMMDDDTNPLMDTDAILEGEGEYESEELAENYGDYNYNEDYPAEEYAEEGYEEGEYAEEPVYEEPIYDEAAVVENEVPANTPEGVPDETAFIANPGYRFASTNTEPQRVSARDEAYEEEPVFEEPVYEEPALYEREAEDIVNDIVNRHAQTDTFFDDKTGDIIIDTPPAGMVNESAFDDIEKISEDAAMALAAATIGAAVGGTGKIKLTGDTGNLKIDENGKIRTGGFSAKGMPMPEKKPEKAPSNATLVKDEEAKDEAKKVNPAGFTIPLMPVEPAIPGSSVTSPEMFTAKVGNVVNSSSAAASSKSTGNTEKLNKILSLENDGQISLALSSEPVVEKQITGQLNLDDMMDQWESKKHDAELQQQEDIKNSILEKTGNIFDNYDKGAKTGILAQIEEEEKANKRILKNDLELKKADDLKLTEPEVSEDIDDLEDKKPFSATEALNRTFKNTIWDEIEKAESGAAGVAGALAEGAVAAGALVAGAEAAGEAAAAGLAGEVAGDVAGVAAALASDLPIEGATSDEGVTFGDTQIIDSDIKTEAAALAAMEIAESSNDEPIEEDGSQDEQYTDEAYAEDEYAGEYDEQYDEDGNLIEGEYVEGYYDEDGNYVEGYYTDEVYEDEESQYAEESYEDEYAQEDYEEEVAASLNTAEINDIGHALEANAEKVESDVVNESNDDYSVDEERELSVDEKELFGDFLYSKKMRGQILEAVDIINLAPYVGNVIITGDSDTEITALAKAMIKEVQLIDSNFSASKVAKISGLKLNKKDINQIISKLANGALIVENAGELNKDTLENLTKALENDKDGIIIVLTDSKKNIEKLIDSYGIITGYFGARVDITPMNEMALIEYAKKYAYSREYKIDEEKAVLALSERIGELQIGDHNVTTKEIEDIVEDAIWHSERAKISGFVNILLNKRYDYDDMVILREKDFEY